MAKKPHEIRLEAQPDPAAVKEEKSENEVYLRKSLALSPSFVAEQPNINLLVIKTAETDDMIFYKDLNGELKARPKDLFNSLYISLKELITLIR